MGRLSARVLDAAQGCPAAGLRVELFDDAGLLLADVEAGADGTAGAPLLGDDLLQAGRYTLRFHVAAYFRAHGLNLPDPPFLDVVTVSFGIADPAASCQVRLLVSPHAYTVHRGG